MSVSSCCFLLLLLLLLGTLPFAATDTRSAVCPLYRCGHAVNIPYPFWIDNGDDMGGTGNATYCGYPFLRLECHHDSPVLRLPSGEYGVMNISIDDRSISVFDPVVTKTTCPRVAGRNVTLPLGSPPPISFTARNINLTFLLDCSFTEISASHLVQCLQNGQNDSYVFRGGRVPYDKVSQCKEVVIMPVLNPLKDVVPALKVGFELSWTSAVGWQCGACEKTGGLCGQHREVPHDGWIFTCFSRSDIRTSPPTSKYSGGNKFIIVVAIIGTILFIGCIAHCIVFWVKIRQARAVPCGIPDPRSSVHIPRF